MSATTVPEISKKNPYFFIGRVMGLIEMLDEPIYGMTHEKVCDRLRTIISDYQNTETA